jgi:hypothetical protein
MIAGLIGLICAVAAMWIVNQLIEDPNMYVAAGIAGLCGSVAGFLAGSSAGCCGETSS